MGRFQAGLFACLFASLLTACSSGGGETPTEPTRPESPPAVVPATQVTTAIVTLTNEERVRAGLGPLRAEARLTHAAQLQAEQNARLSRLEHVLPEAMYPRPEDRLAAAGYPWQAYGENIAYGYPDASTVVTGWMNSSGHRANILGASFTEIGVGHAFDSAGRPYYAQVFGRPR